MPDQPAPPAHKPGCSFTGPLTDFDSCGCNAPVGLMPDVGEDGIGTTELREVTEGLLVQMRSWATTAESLSNRYLRDVSDAERQELRCIATVMRGLHKNMSEDVPTLARILARYAYYPPLTAAEREEIAEFASSRLARSRLFPEAPNA